MAKAIMVCGTGSHVGKSVITAGICRILKNDGFRVAPFKSQNMALNSYVTEDGGEMGRAQVVQAFASGIKPHVDMNPILIKPCSDVGAQVILLGKAKGNMNVKNYMAFKKEALRVAKGAFRRLTKKYDVIVMEGAGSPAEINIPDDIVNMPMAKIAKAPVILIGDIDLGGVFAWIVGTLNLLKPSQRRMIKGFIINKFRGDLDILKPGLSMLEERTKKSVLGVVPYFRDIKIEEEDSVQSSRFNDPIFKHKNSDGKINIEVLYLPHISNFTDFDPFLKEEDVNLRYVKMGEKIGNPDLLIIPGTKNTIQDLVFLKRAGYTDKIRSLAKNGLSVMGICGGFQMLGTKIIDIKGSESSLSKCDGLSFFNIVTRLMPSKVTSQIEFEGYGLSSLSGYEIHLGRTKYLNGSKSLFKITKRGQRKVEIPDGAINEKGNILGTYIHGIFDNDNFRSVFLNILREKKSLPKKEATTLNKDREFEKLENLLRIHLNIEKIYDIIGIQKPPVIARTPKAAEAISKT